MYSVFSALSRVTPPSRVAPLYGRINIYTLALLTRLLIVTGPLFLMKHLLTVPIGLACHLLHKMSHFLPVFCHLGVIVLTPLAYMLVMTFKKKGSRGIDFVEVIKVFICHNLHNYAHARGLKKNQTFRAWRVFCDECKQLFVAYADLNWEIFPYWRLFARALG